MAHILFTMADVEIAQFRKRTPVPIDPSWDDTTDVDVRRPRPDAAARQRVRDRQAFDTRTGRKIGAAGRRIGAGATYLRRTASGAVTAVRNNPGKTALIAAGLAAAATAGGYLLNKGKKKGKQDYSRQIRTVYFSRRHE